MASKDVSSSPSLSIPLPPPPSASTSFLSPPAHSFASSSPSSRPIPIEIYDHILHFAFGRHLPPLPLEDQLDEPPSLTPLLPLTLVSKGLRELVLPFLYYHITIRQPEDWTRLLDPTEGVLVGGGEEATRRRGWIKKLSFARDGFPVASWTPSKYHPAGATKPRAIPRMAALDYSGLSHLKEVYIGNWRASSEGMDKQIDDALDEEMEGGASRDALVASFAEGGEGVSDEWLKIFIRDELNDTYFEYQSLSLLAFLHHAHPSVVHISFDPLAGEPETPSVGHHISIVVHPLWDHDLGPTREDLDDALSSTVHFFGTTFPSSKFNFDSALENLVEEGRVPLLAWLDESDWMKDEAGWWTWD